MKRGPSDIPSSPISSASDADVKPEIPSTSLKSKRSQPTPKTPSPNKKIKKEATGEGIGAGNGEWDSEKKAIMTDTIIAAGYKATDLDSLAAKLGLSKRQIINQVQPGRKGSLREKAVQAVKGDK